MRRSERGFTLIELIVVTALLVIVAGTLGTFFLAGASPAVAAAERDVNAAFDEARRTALADDAATVVFAPAASGTGFAARVYRRMPGDPQFAARSGPEYTSSVTIAETASPLGAPGFAFAVDSGGTVTGFANFAVNAPSFTSRPCPASGAFTLQLAYERDTRTITVPCTLVPSGAAPVAFQTPAPAFTTTPFPPAAGCPSGAACSLTAVTPAPAAACPPGTAPDATVTGLCDALSGAPPATAAPAPQPTGAATSTPAPAPPSTPAGIIEQYSATANEQGSHTATLFADGSICDDDGCSNVGAIVWTWACARAGISGTTGNDGNNAPYQPDNAFDGAVGSMIADADHDAAEADGDGLVTTVDSYCIGFTTPNP